MTDLPFPPYARRFASLLDRECCVWMPSPSVALLSALVTGKGRPKRLLVQENAPAFVSSIGRVAGSSCVNVAAYDIDDVIHGLLRTEGLSPDHVWGIATHRGGKLSPTDWLSRCAVSGIPTIELCMGSLGALARWGPSPATFTIVDLDAEEAFAGARLTALLTGDRAMVARVQQLCLPGPEDQDYIIDARPRGLADDEPALISMVEHAMALFAGKGPAESAPNALTLPWARRFQSPDGDSSLSPRSPDAGPGPVEEHVWSTRLAEAEAHHTEAIREAAANAASLQSKLEGQFALADEWQRRCRAAERAAASQAERDSAAFSEIQKKLDYQQRTIDQWEARFNEAESEAAKDAAILNGARADLLRERNESERALASVRAEKEALAQRLLRTEWERDAAMKNAAASDPRTTSELRHRVEQLEEAAAASADREARQAEAAEALRAQWSARVVRLEADAVVFGKARADLQKRKVDAEHSLALIQAEKEALTGKLADLDAELGEALSDAAKRSAAQRSALEEQSQRAARLEGEVASLTAREATRAREWEASRDASSERIAALEAEVLAGQKALTEKAEKEQALRRLEAESAARIEKLAEVESDRDRLLAEGVERERTLHSAIDEERRRAEKLAKMVAGLEEQSQRAARLEDEVASLTAREATRAREWEASRDASSERIAALEAEVLAGQKALTEKAEKEQALRRLEAESAARTEKLAEVESDRDRLLAEGVERERTLHSAIDEERRRAEELAKMVAGLEEQSQRSARLEGEVASLTAREATRAREWEASRDASSGRIAALEAEVRAGQKALTEKAEKEQALGRLEAESAARIEKLAEVESDRDRLLAEGVGRERTLHSAIDEERRRAEGLAKMVAGLEEQSQHAARLEDEVASLTAREATRAQEWEASRDASSRRIAALEAEVLAGQKALTEKAEKEQALGRLEAESAARTEKLAEVESDRDRLLAEGVERERTLHSAIDKERRRAEGLAKMVAGLEEQIQRAARLEGEVASLTAREATRAREWAAAQAGLLEQIRRLEAGAALAGHQGADVRARFEESERSRALFQSEREALSEKLRAAEGARDLARADAAGREEAQRAEIEEQRQRAAQLERDAAVRTEQEKRLIAEWGAQRAALTERIAGMKAAAGEAEKARADLIAQKAQADQARDSIRAERDALGRKLTLMEKEHSTALAEATRSEDAQRVALEAEKRRAGKLAGEAAALVEREAKLMREGEESRSELMERIRGLEGPAALFGSAQAELLAQKTEAERAFGLMRAESETMVLRLADLERELHDVRTDAARRQEMHHAELEEPKRREEQVKLDAKAAAEREAKQAEAREASRADLVVRIARLEAAEVVADKARTELLNRKRDSDRALATAQAEVLALIKKLATAERELEEVHAAHRPTRGPAVRPATDHARPPTEPAAPSSPGDVLGPHNSGGLSALVNLWSTAIIRRPSRSKESEEKHPDPPVEAVPGIEAIPDGAPSPNGSVPRREGDGQGKPPDVAPKHNTGGLNALVGLWNTAKTMRPHRRKEPEGRPPDPPVKLALDMEVIPDEAPSPSAPAPPRPNRPASSGPARPTRRPEPKPAPAPDETEKLGGWLRELAGRVRGKPK